MKTIKTILEKLTEAYDGGFQVDPTYSIDQALLEIENIIFKKVDDAYDDGYEDGIQHEVDCSNQQARDEN